MISEVIVVQFGEKLDFLMNITKTGNSTLSTQISLDASYISRLRRGKRGPLKDKACITSMASYFSSHCQAGHQQKAVLDAMELDPFSRDETTLSSLITQWLSETQKSNDAKTVETFLSGLSNTPVQKMQPFRILEETESNNQQTQVAIHYGIEGKRQAVISFLTAVAAQDSFQTLLLFSDEATDWMTTSREFLMKWASLMFQVLEKGNRIRIIHTISRDLDEMLSAISQWMPLYMTGAIEPYFYPKKRDGIFKRTLFIAPETGAVVSSSIGDMQDQEANLFLKDKTAVKAFEAEFNQYFKLCKPLMGIFTAKDQAAYYNTLFGFENEKSDSLIKTESLSLLTMPTNVLSNIISRLGKHPLDLSGAQNKRFQLFQNTLKTCRISEIIRLPDIKTALTPHKIKIASSVMQCGGELYYSPEEYILHLEHLVSLLKTYHNFFVYLTEITTDDRYMVYAREDVGAIVAKTSVPPVVLAMDEPNMTAAFWDFLMQIIGETAYQNPDKKETITRLTEYIKLLRQGQSY